MSIAIAEPIRHLVVPIDTLNPYPGNARRGDLPQLCGSLRRNGQFRPIVVNRRDNVILAGNHTWQAMVSLECSEIAVTFVDVDDDAAARINLADNRSNDIAEYDNAELVSQLQSLPDLTGTGFDDEALNTLMSSIDTTPVDWPAIQESSEHQFICRYSDDDEETLRRFAGDTVLDDPRHVGERVMTAIREH